MKKMLMRTLGLMLTLTLFLGCVTAGEGCAVSAASNMVEMNVTYPSGKLQGEVCGEFYGEVKGGTANGEGVMAFDFGGYYVGEFEDGLPEGEGTYFYEDGTYVSGDWSWGDAEMELYATREGGEMTYVGMFCDGTACGFGALTLEKCGTFYGEFYCGTVCGYGLYAYQSPRPVNQPTIEGDNWSLVMDDKNYGQSYYGLKLDNKWQGFGMGIMSTGSHYVGEVRDDYRQGYGRLYRSGNQLDQEGTFDNGKLMK